MTMRFAWIKYFVLSIVLYAGVGCSSTQVEGSAPIGKQAALENLAQAYMQRSERLPMSADRLPDKARKAFIVSVFEQAGYGYTATLKELVSGQYDIKEKSIRDMVELVTLPHRYMKWDDRVLERLYSTEEIGYIKRLHRMQQ